MSLQPPTPPRVTHPETKGDTHVEVIEQATIAKFQEVPGYVYWHDPYYVPPLRGAERRFLDPKRNPFFLHAEARLFVAKHGREKPVGRIAAAIDRDFDEKTGNKYGFFGYFEFLGDARLPETLLRAAVAWLREKGAEEIVGPCCFTVNHASCGLLVDGFDDDPTIETAYNPVNYHGHFARLPLEKWRDLYGYEIAAAPPPERVAKAASRLRERRGLAVRPVDMRRFEQELELVRTLYNDAWAGNTGAVPIRAEEMRFLAGALRGAIDPALLLVLEEKGKPVGFSVTLPDWNRVLKHLNGSLFPFGWLKAMLLRRTIDRVRVLLFGVTGPARRGRAAVLLDATWRAVHERGYKKADVSWIIEDNKPAIDLVEGLGGKRTRTWRLFRLLPGAFA